MLTSLQQCMYKINGLNKRRTTHSVLNPPVLGGTLIFSVGWIPLSSLGVPPHLDWLQAWPGVHPQKGLGTTDLGVPPLVDRQDTCENITFCRATYAGRKNWLTDWLLTWLPAQSWTRNRGPCLELGWYKPSLSHSYHSVQSVDNIFHLTVQFLDWKRDSFIEICTSSKTRCVS